MNKEEILEWLETYSYSYPPARYIINKDMSIDVEGDVKLTKIPDDRIPEGIKFNIVSGVFDCNNNKLTTLEGCPKEVGGWFRCYSNKLKTLEGAPEKVNGDFICYNNKLTSLEGYPKEVSGSFDCAYNIRDRLKGCPKEVGGTFDCSNNDLTTLEGCPEKVKDDFFCDKNKLIGIKYMPVIKHKCVTDFRQEKVKIEQDIMKEAKSYKEGVQAYQEYLDIFGDD